MLPSGHQLVNTVVEGMLVNLDLVRHTVRCTEQALRLVGGWEQPDIECKQKVKVRGSEAR